MKRSSAVPIAACALVLALAAGPAQGEPEALPPTAPAPELLREPSSPEEQAPVPQPRPETAPPAQPAPVDAEAPPLPDAPEEPGAGTTEALAPERQAAMPPEEVSCRARLKQMGAVFEERPRVSDPAGCVIGHPLLLTRLTASVELQPGALLTCEMAEAAAGFAAETIAPAAKAAFGQELAAVSSASGYVCRPRGGTKTLSEHAFGNALDISGFVLADGRTIAVTAAEDPGEANFLAAVRGAACGPFRTVLGPGTDADHADHLHLDLAPRRNDATYCR